MGIALIVSRFVDAAARRAIDAARARSQARSLARLAATMGDEDPLHSLLEHVRTVFGADAAALLRRAGHRDWQVEAAAGEPVPADPEAANTVEELTPDLALVLTGPSISAEDQLVLNAFGDQLVTVLEQSRLRAEASRANALAEANALRSALLEAVSHDLRPPLASIKAAASSLKRTEVKSSPEQVAGLADTVDEEADRLTALVGNLLDMSRIQAGALRPTLSATQLAEILSAAVLSLGA